MVPDLVYMDIFLQFVRSLKKIFLHKKYKKKIKFKNNLKKIQWYINIKNILPKISHAVIAKPPNKQLKLVKYIFENNKKINFFLEKPLGPTPSKANELLWFLKKKKFYLKLDSFFLI